MLKTYLFYAKSEHQDIEELVDAESKTEAVHKFMDIVKEWSYQEVARRVTEFKSL